jgi:hypothetical protein
MNNFMGTSVFSERKIEEKVLTTYNNATDTIYRNVTFKPVASA